MDLVGEMVLRHLAPGHAGEVEPHAGLPAATGLGWRGCRFSGHAVPRGTPIGCLIVSGIIRGSSAALARSGEFDLLPSCRSQLRPARPRPAGRPVGRHLPRPGHLPLPAGAGQRSRGRAGSGRWPGVSSRACSRPLPWSATARRPATRSSPTASCQPSGCTWSTLASHPECGPGPDPEADAAPPALLGPADPRRPPETCSTSARTSPASGSTSCWGPSPASAGPFRRPA